MSGITGAVWTAEGEPISSDVLQRMLAAVQHRGPGGRGEYRCDVRRGAAHVPVPGAALGHCRHGDGESQPIVNDAGTVWAVLDGSIVNAPLLRRRLQATGHCFRANESPAARLSSGRMSGSPVGVELSTRVAAPRDRVWRILADHEGMPRWFPVREVVRRRPGATDPDGVGAIRVCRGAGLVVEEEVTIHAPCERLETRLRGGAPWSRHRSEIVLQPDAAGTRVRWCVDLAPRMTGTGWLVRRLLERALRRGLAGLRRAAETADGRDAA